MGLQSNIPTDKRRPGTFHTFDDTSSARSLVPIQRSLLLIGMKHSSGTWALNTPVQVFNEREAELGAGKSSELSIMVRIALATFRALGSFAQLWCIPIAEPAGVAATRTFTITGTATEAGDVVVRICGRTIRGAVKSGDTQNTIAASLKAAIDVALSDLPVTTGVATNVVTLTYRHLGVNGNDLLIEEVSAPAGVTNATASPVSGTGVADIQPALDVAGSRDYLAVAIANHAAQDVTDFGEHADLMWAASKKRYRHMFLCSTGTLGSATTLASPPNRKEILVVSFEGGRMLPAEYAASVAAMTQTKERPSFNWDGTELPLYGTADANVYEDAEVETALLGGVTPLTVTDVGKVLVERLVTTKATLSGAAFENLRDFAVSATTAYYARQLDAKLAPAIKGQNVDTTLLRELRDLAYDVLKQGEALGDLHHVDDHAEELVVDAHPSLPSRVLVEFPQSVVPNAHQVDVTHRLFVEAA